MNDKIVAKSCMTLGESVRNRRLKMELSVNHVAEKSGVSRSTVWRLEKGEQGVMLSSAVRIFLTLKIKISTNE